MKIRGFFAFVYFLLSAFDAQNLPDVVHLFPSTLLLRHCEG